MAVFSLTSIQPDFFFWTTPCWQLEKSRFKDFSRLQVKPMQNHNKKEPCGTCALWGTHLINAKPSFAMMNTPFIPEKKSITSVFVFKKKNRGHSLNLERHLVWVGSISLCLCVSIPFWACVLMRVGVFVLSTCTVYLRIDALVEGALKVSSQTC